MTAPNCPHHEFVPVFTQTVDGLEFTRFFTSKKSYPFQCLNCQLIELVDLYSAVDRGWAVVVDERYTAGTLGLRA